MISMGTTSLLGECGILVPDAQRSEDMKALRTQFPAISGNPNTIFFDNAATAQKPKQVIEKMRSYYEDNCANANRAAYALSSKLHHQVEETRRKVAKFINAQAVDVAFTYGATDSLNLVALAWGLHNLNDGDQIMLCLEDHQSAILPWFNLKQHLSFFNKNIQIVPFVMHYSGIYDRTDVYKKIGPHTRLVAMTHIHHLYGLEWDASDIVQVKTRLPSNALISFDISQSVGHTAIDVEQLGVDFVSFSGHKMFAANGIGVLWVNPKVREQLCPVRLGSKSTAAIVDGIIKMDKTSLAGILESGTLNLPAIYSLNSAIEFIEIIGINKIEAHISYLTHVLHDKLKTLPTIEFAPGLNNYNCAKGFGIISFRFPGISSSDMAQYLDQQDIQVRSGDHCLAIEPNIETDYIRVSLQIYNTEEEIDLFIEFLKQAL